jgi:putative phosphonate metabolism protein
MRSSYHARIDQASRTADDMRYAIYFAPSEEGGLWKAGCHWLGRDPLRTVSLSRPRVPHVSSRTVAAMTTKPRRYGFHATLKPPFRLVEDETPENLRAALAEFACQRAAFALPRLEVGELGDFLALRALEECPELDRLAEECVVNFDRFRRCQSREELARRSHGLDARQRVLLERWGYPYVMDQWRFHMTLTGEVPEPHAGAITGFLRRWFEPVLREPLWVTDLCLYIEEKAGGEFRLGGRFPLANPA